MTPVQKARLRDVLAYGPMELQQGDKQLVMLGWLDRESYGLGEAVVSEKLVKAPGLILPARHHDN